MHPIDMGAVTRAQYDRQLLAYFDYWRARGLKNLSQHPDYARYKTLAGATQRKKRR